jgi:glucokinase
VAQARLQGDPFAERLVRETGELLGAALVSLVNAFNPKRVILGGGIIDGFPELVSLAHAHVRERALLAALQGLDVIPATLANDAPAIGAAAMARHLLDSGTPGVAP